MVINETALYKFALENKHIFPDGDYTLQLIYDTFQKFVFIPEEHYEDRPDVSYPLWKNYIHSVRPTVERIEYLGKKKYRFK